jgi:hypothetical protein
MLAEMGNPTDLDFMTSTAESRPAKSLHSGSCQPCQSRLTARSGSGASSSSLRAFIRLLGRSLCEVPSLQHADESFGRVLQTVDEVLAVADAALGDGGTNVSQECSIVLGGKLSVDEAFTSLRGIRARNF